MHLFTICTLYFSIIISLLVHFTWFFRFSVPRHMALSAFSGQSPSLPAECCPTDPVFRILPEKHTPKRSLHTILLLLHSFCKRHKQDIILSTNILFHLLSPKSFPLLVMTYSPSGYRTANPPATSILFIIWAEHRILFPKFLAVSLFPVRFSNILLSTNSVCFATTGTTSCVTNSNMSVSSKSFWLNPSFWPERFLQPL